MHYLYLSKHIYRNYSQQHIICHSKFKKLMTFFQQCMSHIEKQKVNLLDAFYAFSSVTCHKKLHWFYFYFYMDFGLKRLQFCIQFFYLIKAKYPMKNQKIISSDNLPSKVHNIVKNDMLYQYTLCFPVSLYLYFLHIFLRTPLLVYCFIFLIHTYIHNWPLQPFSQDY